MQRIGRVQRSFAANPLNAHSGNLRLVTDIHKARGHPWTGKTFQFLLKGCIQPIWLRRLLIHKLGDDFLDRLDMLNADQLLIEAAIEVR